MGFRRVVGVGLSVLDHLYVVDDDRLPGIRTRYHAMRVSPGGMVSTAVAQAAQLGCEAHLVSALGTDRAAGEILRELRGLGVRTRRVRRDPDCRTDVAAVVVHRKTGARRFIVPDRRALERGVRDFDLSVIRPGTVLLVDGHFPSQAVKAMKRTRELGGVVVGDLSDARPAFTRLLPLIDYPILPADFARGWGVGDSRDTLRALKSRYGGVPVVTEGRRGALVLESGRIRRIAPHRVRVRDTTGAGDVFHGAFAAGLVHGRSVIGALELAARAAALACTELGGLGRLMTEREMKQLRSGGN
jgi:sulfofructose kinase